MPISQTISTKINIRKKGGETKINTHKKVVLLIPSLPNRHPQNQNHPFLVPPQETQTAHHTPPQTTQKNTHRYLIILTRRCALSSRKSSCICPKSAALPWEYNNVNLPAGCLQNVATILLPPLVSNKCTFTFLSGDNPLITSLPSTSSLYTSYVGGSGGKNANFAATLDVTFPIYFIEQNSHQDSAFQHEKTEFGPWTNLQLFWDCQNMGFFSTPFLGLAFFFSSYSLFLRFFFNLPSPCFFLLVLLRPLFSFSLFFLVFWGFARWWQERYWRIRSKREKETEELKEAKRKKERKEWGCITYVCVCVFMYLCVACLWLFLFLFSFFFLVSGMKLQLCWCMDTHESYD